MDAKKTEHFKDLLSKQVNHIENTLDLMKENNDANEDIYSPTELSHYDNHPAEIASQLYELEHNLALKVHEEYSLKEIKDALGRIEKGTFGQCIYCGKDIKEERLEIVPYTRLCIECETEKSKDVETLRIKPPYIEEQLHAEKLLNIYDEDNFEGIDILNDLTKYGSSDSPQDMGENRDLEEYYTNKLDYQGVVDHMDNISNEQYKRQLPD